MKKLSPKAEENKRQEIWQGILSKAQQDHDHSLDGVEVSQTAYRYINLWAMAAAACFVILFSILFLYRADTRQTNLLSDSNLSEVFADSTSVTRLVLSTGDTILLTDDKDWNRDIVTLDGSNASLDFREIEHEGLADNIQVVETGRGKQMHVILPDGTDVWLNAASRIEFPAKFQSDERHVKTFGEVYFEVYPNKHTPFVVEMSGQHVRVLGTHFNTRHYSDEKIETVSLLEGSVEVIGSSSAQKVALLPGQQSSKAVNQAGLHVRTLSNPEATIAWRNGEFYFEDAGAGTIVQELERWYPVSISLKGQDNTKKISGRLKRSASLKEVVDMLRFFHIEIQVEQK